MPELPEVQTTINYIKQYVLGKTVSSFSYTNKGISHFNIAPRELETRLIGNSLNKLGRYGKWMIFEFGPTTVIGHLRMSGRYKVLSGEEAHPHERFTLDFEGTKLSYIDQRRFGTFHVVDSVNDFLEKKQLGIDALDPSLSASLLAKHLSTTSRPIYTVLLDQRVIAGLGNIYVNEVLHSSRIHPLAKANSLTHKQIEALVSEIKRILNLALSLKGTTLIDNLYQDPEGSEGEFAQLLKVYGQKSNPDISVMKIGGRSVFVHKDTKLET